MTEPLTQIRILGTIAGQKQIGEGRWHIRLDGSWEWLHIGPEPLFGPGDPVDIIIRKRNHA